MAYSSAREVVPQAVARIRNVQQPTHEVYKREKNVSLGYYNHRVRTTVDLRTRVESRESNGLHSPNLALSPWWRSAFAVYYVALSKAYAP